MIEILKQGQLPQEDYFGTCSYCGCEVKANLLDHSATWLPSNKKNAIIQVGCPMEGCKSTIRCKRKKQV